MATRLYLPSSGTAPLASLGFQADWERSTGFVRRPCFTTKQNTSLATDTRTWAGATTVQWVWSQYQSPPMRDTYDWTTADTISMVIGKCAETTTSGDTHLAYIVKVVSGDGSTVRGVVGLYHATSTEYALVASAATRIHSARNAGATNFTSQPGDRIIIELGVHGVTPALEAIQMRFGDPSGTSDFALTAALTTDLCPWVELSKTVIFAVAYTHTPSAGAILGGAATVDTYEAPALQTYSQTGSGGALLGGAATVATDTAYVLLSLSNNIAASAATATTAQLTAPSGKTSSNFQAGKISDDTNPLPSIDLDENRYTELEFSLITGGNLASGDEVEFRITNNGTVIDSYTVTPKITVAVTTQSYSQTGSGGSLLGGAASQARAQVNIVSRGVILGGAGTQKRVQVSLVSSGVLLGGAATQKRAQVNIVSRGVILGGAAGQKQLQISPVSRGVLLGGAAGQKQLQISLASRGVVLGGAAVQKRTQVNPVSSGILLGGAIAPARVVRAFTGGSGLILGGSAGVKTISTMVSQGGITLGGAATVTWEYQTPGNTYSQTGSGGVLLGGAVAAPRVTRSFAGSSGLVVGGAATTSRINLQVYTHSPTSGLILGGAVAAPRIVRAFSSSGGSLLGGQAPFSISRSYIITGGALLGGATSFSISRVSLPTGGAILGGAADVRTTLAGEPQEYTHSPMGGILLGGAAIIELVIQQPITPPVTVNLGGGSFSSWASIPPHVWHNIEEEEVMIIISAFLLLLENVE